MNRTSALLNPLLWSGFSIAMAAITGISYLLGSYKISEQCYYIAQDFAVSRGALPESIGDVDATRSLIPLGPSCTWSHEGQTAVLYPFSTGVITTFAAITLVLIAVTVLMGVVRRAR